jgi:DNA polymerase-1
MRLRRKFRPYFVPSNVKRMDPRYSQDFKHLLDMEVTLEPITAEMELVGSWVDTDHLVSLSNHLRDEAAAHANRVIQIANNPQLNPHSTKQMVELLYGQMHVKHPDGKRRNQQGSKGMLTRKTLEKMQVKVRENAQKTYGGWPKAALVELLDNYLNMTKLTTIDSRYTHSMIEAISDDGKLHTSFNQHGTRSGRYSSEDPNFQNMPRNTDPESPTYKYDVRAAFLANKKKPHYEYAKGELPEYVYVLCDYSQMEMKICAALSGCRVLYDIVTGIRRDKNGNRIDIHLYTACEAFRLDYDYCVQVLADPNHPEYAKIKEYRQKAKPVNFGIIYGMTKYGLAAELNEPVRFAETIIAGYMRAYPGVAAWMDRTRQTLRSKFYTETTYGRRRRASWSELQDDGAAKTAFRACLNHQIQGTGADVVKDAMIRVHHELRKRKLKSKISAQIHDEIIGLAPFTEAVQVAQLMEQAMLDQIPLYGSGGQVMVPLPAEAEIKFSWSKLIKPLWSTAKPEWNMAPWFKFIGQAA